MKKQKYSRKKRMEKWQRTIQKLTIGDNPLNEATLDAVERRNPRRNSISRDEMETATLWRTREGIAIWVCISEFSITIINRREISVIKPRVYVSARLSPGQGGRVIVRCQCISNDPDVNRDVCLSLLILSLDLILSLSLSCSFIFLACSDTSRILIDCSFTWCFSFLLIIQYSYVLSTLIEHSRLCSTELEKRQRNTKQCANMLRIFVKSRRFGMLSVPCKLARKYFLRRDCELHIISLKNS